MEMAARAHFDGVTKNWIGTTFESKQLSTSVGAGATGGKPSTEDVGHLDEFILITHWAILFGRSTDVFGSAKELRVGITDVLFLDLSRGEAREQRMTDEPKLDDGAIRGGGSAFAFHWFEATRLSVPANLPGFRA